MNWLNDFSGKIEPDAPLADRTWFKLGGNARWLATPASTRELADVLRLASEHGVSVKALGAGANVLVRDDGFDGVVVRLDQEAFTAVRFDGERVHAGGGANLMHLAHRCAQRGLSGLEAVAGIPSTVGGAIRMNAGGRYGEIAEVVEEVCMVDSTGRVHARRRDELAFGYRSSNIGGDVVVSACFRLRQSDAALTLAEFRRIWAEKKESQPMAERSAGCIFKNPSGCSAGALIDAAGLKGSARGGASVSTRHANFIVTRPEARSADVLEVIDHVRDVVACRYGIGLELEIDVW